MRKKEGQLVEKSIEDFSNLMKTPDFLANLRVILPNAKKDCLSGTLDIQVLTVLSELMKSSRLQNENIFEEFSFVLDSYRKAVLAGDREGYLVRLRTLAKGNLIFHEVFSGLMTLISDAKISSTISEDKTFSTAPEIVNGGCGGSRVSPRGGGC